MNYLAALNTALAGLLERDPLVLLLGEDIEDPYGGAFKVTRGLSGRFPGRVLSTPISESALAGLAGGLALRGMKPVLEIMFGDFLTLCCDQLLNHAAKFDPMYAGQTRASLVVRTPMGGGRGYGPTHSQSLEKHFLGTPGLQVVAPSLAHHPGRLLERAVNDAGPVLFIEHKLLYPQRLLDPGDLPRPLRLEQSADDYPVVSLSNFPAGSPDVALVLYGGGSLLLRELLLEMAAEEIRLTCLLPSLISRPPMAELAELAGRTRHGLIVFEEGAAGFDWGAEILAGLAERGLGRRLVLRRVAARPTLIPAARALERLVLPGLPQVRDAIFSLLEQTS